MPAFHCVLGHGLVVGVVHHPGALAAGLAVDAAQLPVVERALGQGALAAGGAFDGVHIGQPQRPQLRQQIVEQLLRVVVLDAVGRRDRREADGSALAADFVHHAAHHFQHQAGAVPDAAAIVVRALVGAGFQKLVQQVAVGAVDFHAVKTAGNGVARRMAEVQHDAGQLGGVERARHRRFHARGHALADQHRLGVRADGRRRHRRGVVRLQVGVRDAAHMPQLRHDGAAGLVHGFGHALPAVELLGAVQAGHVGVALRLRADGGGLGNQQAGAGALRVIGGHQRRGDGARRAVARQRRHGNAVVQPQGAGGGGLVEKVGHGTGLSWLQCCSCKARAAGLQG